MLRRALGLLLIVRAFIPLIAVLVIVWGLSDMVADVRGPLVRRANVIDAELDELSEVVDVALAQFATVNANLGAVLTYLPDVDFDITMPSLPQNLSLPGVTLPDPVVAVPNGVSITWDDFSYEVQEWVPRNCGVFDFLCDAADFVLQTVTRLLRYPTGISVSTGSFRLNTPDIPALNLALPAVVYDLQEGMQAAFDGLYDLFDLTGGTLQTVIGLGDKLQALPNHADQIITSGQQVIDAGLDVLRQWRNVLVPAGIGIILLVVYAFFAQLIGNVARGWRLLFGPAPMATPAASSAGESPPSPNR
jgi:hypothetical protein